LAALKNAQAAGYSRQTALIAKAESIIQELPSQEGQLRWQMCHDISQWHTKENMDMESLQRLRESFVQNIALARFLDFPDADICQAEAYKRRVHQAIQDKRGQIRVFCRIRPLSPQEVQSADVTVVHKFDDTTVEVPQGMFCFDGVSDNCNQQHIFQECQDLVQSVVDGINVSMIVYGQTGAGKTYTMFGKPDNEGIAGRSIDEIFSILHGMAHDCTHSVTISVVEVYSKSVMDCLRQVKGRGQTELLSQSQGLKVKTEQSGTVRIENLTEISVKSAAELKSVLSAGFAKRTVASTAAHGESSRSHLVCTIRVTTKNRRTQEVTSGKLMLCDLAGSERLKKAMACPTRRREAIEINSSLSALGDVVEAIIRKRACVPYRNHVLTNVLRESLSGSGKTLMFINCSPARRNLKETFQSLMFGSRATAVPTMVEGVAENATLPR